MQLCSSETCCFQLADRIDNKIVQAIPYGHHRPLDCGPSTPDRSPIFLLEENGTPRSGNLVEKDLDFRDELINVSNAHNSEAKPPQTESQAARGRGAAWGDSHDSRCTLKIDACFYRVHFYDTCSIKQSL